MVLGGDGCDLIRGAKEIGCYAMPVMPVKPALDEGWLAWAGGSTVYAGVSTDYRLQLCCFNTSTRSNMK